MNQPLTTLDLDEIAARAARLYERTATIDPNAHPDFGQLTDSDVPALLAEVHRLRAELTTQADDIVKHCPDHGPAEQPTVWMDCHCAVADDMRRRAAASVAAVSSATENGDAS